MCADFVSSDKYEGQRLCTIDDVIDEIGPVLSKQSSAVFPDNRRDQIIGRWCEREEAKFYEMIGVSRSKLKGNLLEMSKDAVLFRVVVRVLKKIQANRTQRAGGVPSYQELIESYNREQEMLELYIRSCFYPDAKLRGRDYPESFSVTIYVSDKETKEPLPGARVFIDNDWVSSTWHDGYTELSLVRGKEYSVNVRMVGYKDSEFKEVSDDSEIVFLLEKE